MKSSPDSAPGEWVRCTGRGIPVSTASWRSRSCRRRSQRTRSSWRASSPRPAPPPPLNHPNIITIHDIGSVDGMSYILMELVDGKDRSRTAQRRAAAAQEDSPDRRPGGRRTGRRPCARHRAPGPEAREPDGVQGWRRQDPRLRSCQDDTALCPAGRRHRLVRSRRDAARERARHGRLHVAGAGLGASFWTSAPTSSPSARSSTRWSRASVPGRGTRLPRR